MPIKDEKHTSQAVADASEEEMEVPGAKNVLEGIEVGGNSMASMEPFGALIGAVIGGVEALGSPRDTSHTKALKPKKSPK